MEDRIVKEYYTTWGRFDVWEVDSDEEKQSETKVMLIIRQSNIVSASPDTFDWQHNPFADNYGSNVLLTHALLYL